jgi:hypothetical protein
MNGLEGRVEVDGEQEGVAWRNVHVITESRQSECNKYHGDRVTKATYKAYRQS